MPLALSRLILLPSTIISGIELVQLTDESQNTVGSIHRLTGWYVVGLLGLIGVWGLVFAIARRRPGRAFMIGFGLGVVAALLQVTLGVIAYSSGVDPGNQHVFYGVVLVFTLAFAYIYRLQFVKRPAWSLGLLALFLMGLGIRGILTFGNNFGS